MIRGIISADARIRDTTQLKVLNIAKNPITAVIISSTAGSMPAVAVAPL